MVSSFWGNASSQTLLSPEYPASRIFPSVQSTTICLNLFMTLGPESYCRYSDKTVLGTVLVNPGKMTADITFSTAPMADLTVGADVKELNLGASSLKTLTTKASYTSGPIFAAFSLTPQVDPGFAVRPISEATQSLFASYDASSDMAVGLNFERSFSAKTVFSKLNASVQYVYSKETTVRAAVNHEFPVQPKKDEAVNPSSQRTAFSAGIAHKLAKGATAIINVKYIDSPKFGLQLNFDA